MSLPIDGSLLPSSADELLDPLPLENKPSSTATTSTLPTKEQLVEECAWINAAPLLNAGNWVRLGIGSSGVRLSEQKWRDVEKTIMGYEIWFHSMVDRSPHTVLALSKIRPTLEKVSKVFLDAIVGALPLNFKVKDEPIKDFFERSMALGYPHSPEGETIKVEKGDVLSISSDAKTATLKKLNGRLYSFEVEAVEIGLRGLKKRLAKKSGGSLHSPLANKSFTVTADGSLILKKGSGYSVKLPEGQALPTWKKESKAK